MKKILTTLIIMLGLTFLLSSCDITTPQNNDSNTSNVITYYDEETLYITQEVETGQKATRPTTPTKDNYIFEYWTYQSNQFSFDTIINEDIMLQAKWREYDEDNPENNIVVTEDGLYTSKDEVALYIATFHKLPSNYMTKAEAGGSIKTLWTTTNKASIGGDTFGNRERLLPSAPGRTFIELDIDYNGGSRGAKRIVYSSDFRIFYTSDHYDSFVEYDKETREWKSY